MPRYSPPYVLQCVEVAMVRRAAEVRCEIRRGLWSLPLIASLAPFFGFFGTVLGIFRLFRSFGTSQSTILAYITKTISESMAPTLLGLLVAILAYCSHRYLESRAGEIDIEINCATSDLINALRLYLHRLRVERPAAGAVLSRPRSDEHTGRERDLKSSPVRLRLRLQRMYRHGVFELVWPNLRSPFDSEVMAQAAGGVCGVYGFVCLFSGWLYNRPFTGVALAAFFSAAGVSVAARSRQALLTVYGFLLLSAILCIIDFGPSFISYCCIGAAVPLIGTWRTSWPILPRRSIFRIVALPAVTCCAIIAVAFSTMLFSSETKSGDFSMAPTVRPGDRLIGIGRGLAGTAKRGELWEIGIGGYGVARVIGIPGDDIQIRVGKLILNGAPIDEPYVKVYTDAIGDFPLPNQAYEEVFLGSTHERAYGRRMSVSTIYRVPADHYFVLNDNRKEIYDSRVLGPLSRDQLIAKSLLLWRRSSR